MPDRAGEPGQNCILDGASAAPALILKAGFELSDRQRQVLYLVALGCTDKAIALKLGIHPRTVGAHLQKAREGLGAIDRTHAAVIALSFGLIKFEIVTESCGYGQKGKG